MSERLRLRWAAALALFAFLFLAPDLAVAGTRQVIGRSVQGRPIVLFRSGPSSPVLKVLVFGAIHGNEPAGMRIAHRLIAAPALKRAELLVVPTINPDGLAAHTRGNAHGVDLNRNFPYRWRPLSGGEYSGTGPLSEPESRVAQRLILRTQPDVTIWFHQPFGLVDRPDGNPFVARRFSRLIGLPLVRCPAAIRAAPRAGRTTASRTAPRSSLSCPTESVVRSSGAAPSPSAPSPRSWQAPHLEPLAGLTRGC